MVCYVPISSPFIRLGGHWVDDALSFAMGWNFFLNMGESRYEADNGLENSFRKLTNIYSVPGSV